MHAGGTFRDLVAWQVGIELAESVYQWTQQLPATERYGLVAQIRRAATSVPLNIAEGWGLGTTPQYIRHCRLARGSLCELETAIEIAQRVCAVQCAEDLMEKRDRCARLLQGLIMSLERKLATDAETAR
jgi:four helix bundle protein